MNLTIHSSRHLNPEIQFPPNMRESPVDVNTIY